MAGENPYLKRTGVEPPSRKYRVTFLPMNVTVEVDPARIPYGSNGLPGSILDISAAAEDQGVCIDHVCGGICACSTCHVIVREGLESCNEPDDAELDQLDQAPGVEMRSRLACSCVPNGARDLTVEIPAWNRNAVMEEKKGASG